jgi:glutathione S-transferase
MLNFIISRGKRKRKRERERLVKLLQEFNQIIYSIKLFSPYLKGDRLRILAMALTYF